MPLLQTTDSSLESVASNTPAIYKLPNEVLHQIVSQLDVKDIIALASTSKTLKALLLDDPDGVWKLLCRRDLHVADSVPPSPYRSFWDLYVHAVTPFHWVKSSLWIGDSIPFGDVYLTKYDRQTGSLALFKLLCRDSDPNNDGTGTVLIINNNSDQDQNQQQPPHTENHLVATSVFFQTNAANPNDNQDNRTMVTQFREPISGNRGGGRQVRQLPSDPDISYYPEQGYALAFGPYICLNKFSERDARTGMWKFPFRTEADSNQGTYQQSSFGNTNSPETYKGPYMGLLRAVAVPSSSLDCRMNVWPPFTIPASDRTRNTSVNDFMGHYNPPVNALNVGGGRGMVDAIARAEAAHNAALAALRDRNGMVNRQNNDRNDDENNNQENDNRNINHFHGVPPHFAETEGIQGFNMNLAGIDPIFPNANTQNDLNNPNNQNNPAPVQTHRTRTVVTRLPNGSVELRTENGDGDVTHVETIAGNTNQDNVGIIGNAGAPRPHEPVEAQAQAQAEVQENEQNDEPRIVPEEAMYNEVLQAHQVAMNINNQLLQNIGLQNAPVPGGNLPNIHQIHQAHLAQIHAGLGGGIPNIPRINGGVHQIHGFQQAHAQHLEHIQNVHNQHIARIRQGQPLNHLPPGLTVFVNDEHVDTNTTGTVLGNNPLGDEQPLPNVDEAAADENAQAHENEVNGNAEVTENANSDSGRQSDTHRTHQSTTLPPPPPIIEEVTPAPTPPNFVPPSPNVFRIQRFMGRIHGKVETLFRLEEELYTPTASCPYRGVWVSSQSFELMLFHQPHPNRLEAIKLTGGTHVRRGEYCFIIDNLNETDPEILPGMYPEFFSPRNPTRNRASPTKPPTRAVKAQGQVSEFNFSNPRFQNMSVFLMSENKIVLFWKVKNIMDVCKRVHVDKLLKTDMNVQKLKD